MDLEQAMQERRSIRGFTDQPVPRALLEEIVSLANRAPSSMNTAILLGLRISIFLLSHNPGSLVPSP